MTKIFHITFPPSVMAFLLRVWILQKENSGHDIILCEELNLAAQGSLFYISISSVGKPSTCIPIWTDRIEKEHKVFLNCFFFLSHRSTWALLLASKSLSLSPCLYFSPTHCSSVFSERFCTFNQY